MADVIWQGGVEAVAQVAEASIDTHDAASTYTVTVGGYTVDQVGDTNVGTTAAALVASLNALTHPYFAAITWSNPSGGTIRATADIAGVPFAASLTVSGGTGTVTDFADTTAATGPHHADDPENWSTGAVPGAGDTLIVRGGPSILYGLDGFSATALARARIEQAFAGRIGLEPIAFATSLDGETVDTSVPEYRGAYLELTADEIIVGEHLGPGSPSGSPRICIEQKQAGASLLDVVETSTAALANRPAVRFLAAHASAHVVVRSAPGGVGIAVEAGEIATVGDVIVVDETAGSSVYVGPGVTLSDYVQHGGIGRLAAAATVTLVEVQGGELVVTGYDYLITTLSVWGGSVIDRHVNTGGDEWTTIHQRGGTLELPRSGEAARAYTTMNLLGGRVEADWSALTGAEVVLDTADVASRRAVTVEVL